MRHYKVGSISEFEEGSRKVVACDKVEIGVFMIKGQLVAWYNSCPHMRGPVCSGRIFKRVLEPLNEDRTVGLQTYSEEHTHIVCPWHGYEFDLLTGLHPGGNKRLKSVDLKIVGDDIYAVI